MLGRSQASSIPFHDMDSASLLIEYPHSPDLGKDQMQREMTFAKSSLGMLKA